MARRVRRGPERRLSPLAWFAIGCGGTLAIGLIALVVVLSLLGARPTPPEAVTSGSTTPAPMAGVPPLEQQIRQAQQAAAGRRAVPVNLVIRQDELNALVAHHMSGEVQNLRVYLGSGTVAATGDVRWRGRTIQLTARGAPVVVSGELQVRLDEVLVGSLSAPASVKAQVQAQLESGLRQLTGRHPLRIDSVSVSPGVMTVQGWAGGQ